MEDEDKLNIDSSKIWKEFKNHPCYADLINQLQERSKDFLEDFKAGRVGTEDSVAKTYDDLRVRINEIAFAVNLVDLIIEGCEAAEKTIEENKEI